MKYKQLTAADRGAIQALLQQSYTVSAIAKVIGFHKSTVSREIKQRSTPYGYIAWSAQLNYETQRKQCKKKTRLSNSSLQKYVVKRLIEGWSPEQIAGRLKLENNNNNQTVICHETIYAWLYHDEWAYKQEKLYQYLRYGRKKRKSWKGRTSHTNKIPNRVSIHKRPDIVKDRVEYGHWEGDSVIYPNKYAINTLNELLSGKVRFTKLQRRTATLTALAISNQLRNEIALTLTLDNGLEFTKHEYVSKETGVKVYFADPYSSFQRGANENVNMLLRGYLPKRYNITNLTQTELDEIAWELNNRPRKRETVQIIVSELLIISLTFLKSL